MVFRSIWSYHVDRILSSPRQPRHAGSPAWQAPFTQETAVASQPSFRAVPHVRRPRLSDTITDQIEDLIASGKLTDLYLTARQNFTYFSIKHFSRW